MICGNLCAAYVEFYVALNSFGAVWNKIQGNAVLEKRFKLTYNEFGQLLNDGLDGVTSISDISNYMAYAHGPFTTAINENLNSTLKCCHICPTKLAQLS